MGSSSRTPGVALVAPETADRLRRAPWDFDFFQAVRLLERMAPGRHPVGRFVPPGAEAVRISAYPTTAFPASQIQSLRFRDDAPPLMEVNFMGLIGPVGMLPIYYTELVADRVRQRDYALREFFDIFQHRMTSIFFQAWEKYRFPIAYERGGLDKFTHHVLDLMGLGTRGLQNRQAVPDGTLAFYAGLYAQHPRSAAALRNVLLDYFEVPVEIEQFVGAWYKLDAETQFQMEDDESVSGQLGFGAVVGDEVWETQGRVRIRLGPLPLERYLEFLPGGTAYEPLRALTRLFGGLELDFEAQLVLKREDVPRCELGATSQEAPRLGWITWARAAAMPRHADETILPL